MKLNSKRLSFGFSQIDVPAYLIHRGDRLADKIVSHVVGRSDDLGS